jgi:hypothetical protein
MSLLRIEEEEMDSFRAKRHFALQVGSLKGVYTVGVLLHLLNPLGAAHCTAM